VKDFGPVPRVEADDARLAQVFINLFVNAAHALTSPSEALERLLDGEWFDAILCDVMMPEMSGIELYQELQKTLPHYVERVVFVTGGAFTPNARAFLDRVPNERMEKPVNTLDLRALVQRFARST
jgi:CheY-like chemotaxis protein